MFSTLEHFYTEAEERLAPFNEFIIGNDLEDKIASDHFGYRCSTNEEFITMRAFFEYEASFLYQSIIASRRIALIKLKTPVSTAAGQLTYLELSDQKPDGSQKSGFDHVEFTPTIHTSETLAQFFHNKNIVFTKTERPHHTTFDHKLASGLTLRIEAIPLITKIINQEILSTEQMITH